MNADVEFHIRHNYPWSKLPTNIKQSLGNSQREYEKSVVNFSVKNQLRYKDNLVRYVRKDEKRYYEELLQYSREHLMLYPYHLSDVMVKGLRITPFAYYVSIMTDIMSQEKSYDSLPNFTAADCLRLMGIGRNQYIDLMNQCRSTKKFFRRKPVKDLLPAQPIEHIMIEPWWVVQAGYITEDDIKVCSVPEKNTIDKIIDSGPQNGGLLDSKVILCLYRRGLVYLDVPIADDDCIIVPPLEGFVMNRVLGDYFETLLYKIFVSIDEHTTVAELASVLQIDLPLVKNAVSMYCRLGFARVKGQEFNTDDWHPSWHQIGGPKATSQEDKLLIDWSTTIDVPLEAPSNTPDTVSLNEASLSDASSLTHVSYTKRIAFLFDSTLTAFLMMGNLSPGLKSHAVTMFEVGKLSDESLDSFLTELEKVDTIAEGEAQRYFDHAITLRDTIRFLRYNKDLYPDQEYCGTGLGVDLLRCESLLGLDPGTCTRVLNKNYNLIISMAPLSNEIRPISSCTPQHIGPAIPEVNSVWFKLFIYHLTGCGPPSLLLMKGTRLRRLPEMFQEYDRLLITTWGHDPGIIPTSNILLTLNDALSHSALLIQAHGWQSDGETIHVPFPLQAKDENDTKVNHGAIQKLSQSLDLKNTCGFVTLLKTGKPGQWAAALEKPEPSPAASTPSLINSVEHDSPVNGIKDTISAEMLASEVDSLATPKRTKAQPPLSLAIDDHNNSMDIIKQEDQDTYEQIVAQDWVLLNCCFGIPLFDADVNKEVCERVAAHNLCSKNSLQSLLYSSRMLSLRLLTFIADHQDLTLTSEHSIDNMLQASPSNPEQNVPLPTRNLCFLDGKLEPWLKC
ncbi:protein FAM91A1-like isoform X2 [Lineus longissimus]|uniref:protein FAM91A1-like isoform X2 n=1 Tax=Lineus longissimus TaxID=88925 RepID=UPI002B4E6AE4